MRLLLFYILLQNSALCVFGQPDSTSKTFIYQILKREPGSDTITYTDKIDTYNNRIFFTNLKKQIIIGYELGTEKKVELILSPTDRRKLSNAVKAAKYFKWKDSLFDNSRMIPGDSLWSHIAKRNKEVSELMRRNPAKDDDRIGAIAHRVSYCSTFQFSNPIYLKDRAILIFYFIRLCGSECGIEDLSVYKLQDGVYKKWLSLGGGAF